ncbi:MAG TPA: FtsX-like permease family protein [Kofleriaceae bacterium]
MDILPIISTLRRHRTAAALIVIEIALTCAIVCNSLFLIRERMARMDASSGIVESELLRVSAGGIGERADARAITDQDLVALRSIPGVKLAATTNMLPFGGSSWNSSISTVPEDPNRPVNAAMYMGSPDLLETFGVRLVMGRDFTPEEYVDLEDVQAQRVHVPSIIITKGVADKLFPGTSPLGKGLYVWGKEPITVVGVIDHIARPNEANGPDIGQYAMIMPVKVPFTLSDYILRVDPARQSEVLAAVDGALDKVDPNRVLNNRQRYSEVRSEYFAKDRSMAYLLAGVSLALLIITALGIVGLASFWVQQRTRQIGIRRALGATRGDILRYFQTENFILATLGIVLGMGLTYGINLWLMSTYKVARLPSSFLPIGATLLYLLGQIAVLGPALRAAAIPPAIATRTV